MQETYIHMDEIVDRIQSHPDVKLTKSNGILGRSGSKQDLTKKPRQHIINSKKLIALMKKSVFILIFICISYGINAQTKWRTLSFNNISGITTTGQKFTAFSSTLSYELNNHWTLSGWSGANFNTNSAKNWLSTQWTVAKKVNNWSFGGGLQYGNGMNIQYQNKDTYLISTITYTIKLK